MQKIAYFTGVGATGKSLVADALSTFCERVAIAPSFTRQWYQDHGFETEADLRKDIDLFLKAQLEMCEQFPVFAQKFINAQTDADLIVFPRSPLDYAAYTIAELGNLVTARTLHLEALSALGRRMNTFIVHFPMDAPWRSENLEDGFRSSEPGRDQDVELEILTMLNIQDQYRNGKLSTAHNFQRHVPTTLHFEEHAKGKDPFDLAFRVNLIAGLCGLRAKPKFRPKP